MTGMVEDVAADLVVSQPRSSFGETLSGAVMESEFVLGMVILDEKTAMILADDMLMFHPLMSWVAPATENDEMEPRVMTTVRSFLVPNSVPHQFLIVDPPFQTLHFESFPAP